MNLVIFRYSAPWRRIAGVLYPETRANLSRANFAARNTGSSPGITVDDGPHEHPVVDPHVSHFIQVPFRTKVKFPHSPHISPS
jgi:hypothetical protein